MRPVPANPYGVVLGRGVPEGGEAKSEAVRDRRPNNDNGRICPISRPFLEKTASVKSR